MEIVFVEATMFECLLWIRSFYIVMPIIDKVNAHDGNVVMMS